MKKYTENDLKKAFNDGKRYGDDTLELPNTGEQTAFDEWNKIFEGELDDHIFIDWKNIKWKEFNWGLIFTIIFYVLFFGAIITGILVTNSAKPLWALILMPTINLNKKTED